METVTVSGLTGYSITDHYRKAIRAIDRIGELEEGSSITIDLSNNNWFTPVFLTPLSVKLNQLRNRGTEVSVNLPRHTGIQIYMDQIGFPFGANNPRQQYKRHLPLCRLNTDDDDDAIDVIGQELRRIIKRHFGGLDAGQTQGINLPISEIIDNVDQHSECNCGAVLVQQYEDRGCLDICIVDDGVTIPGNFEKHGKEFDSDYDAIRLAATGEVSTRGNEGHRARGYGIRSMTKLITDGLNGKVLISSRDATHFHAAGQSPRQVLHGRSWAGTLFLGRMDLPGEDFRVNDYVY
ncbi:hypothetical protein [Halobaculum marinum]|uniref:Histidine kinase-, DNA gyrase B-, and HSP90-like ATPase n=1 Tax=Halobaculum marinum TaxID=3031996 RepID=A0ABD5X2Y2_9EURY|nr:hypothetical protein [Halobaculum sp. DT55]